MIEAQGYHLEQLLIVRIVYAFLKGVLAEGHLPVQGGCQTEEDWHKGEEAQG